MSFRKLIKRIASIVVFLFGLSFMASAVSDLLKFVLPGSSVLSQPDLGLVALGFANSCLLFALAIWLWRRQDSKQEAQPRNLREYGGSFLKFVLDHHKSISFVLIVVLGSHLLSERWHVDDGTPLPFHFRLLAFDSLENRLVVQGYSSSITLNRSRYSFLLPPHIIKKDALEDQDTQFSVQSLSDHEQVITIDYEIALFNHGTSKYRATATNIEPISAHTSSGLYFLATFFGWLAFIIAVFTCRGIWSLKKKLQLRKAAESDTR